MVLILGVMFKVWFLNFPLGVWINVSPLGVNNKVLILGLRLRF